MVAVLGSSALALGLFDDEKRRVPQSPAAAPVRAECVDRVEGGRVSPRSGAETIIGPVTWPALADNYRSLVESGELGPPPGTEYPYRHYPIKALALVEAGKTVMLSVPQRERPYLRLLYGDEGAPRNGASSVTLVACRRRSTPGAQARECRWAPARACRSRHTQFAGGFLIDFDRAPRRGRCAELAVREAGRGVRRERLFGRDTDNCPS